MKKVLIAGTMEGTPNYRKALEHLGASYVVSLTDTDPAGYDGLLLPGGGDMDPALFGEEPDGSEEPDRVLDDTQLDILDRFVKAGKPVFGICRGEQVINVYFGGTLVQDLPSAPAHKSGERDNRHMTHAVPGSFLAELYGTDFVVNSAHHQGVKRLGEGLEIVQQAEDGVVEGYCHRSLPVWAVQWHPERMCECYEKRVSGTVPGEPVLNFFLQQLEDKA